MRIYGQAHRDDGLSVDQGEGQTEAEGELSQGGRSGVCPRPSPDTMRRPSSPFGHKAWPDCGYDTSGLTYVHDFAGVTFATDGRIVLRGDVLPFAADSALVERHDCV